MSIISSPKINEVFSFHEKNRLFAAVEVQVNSYVETQAKSDVAYFIWGRQDKRTLGIYIASLRIIFDRKPISLHPISLQSTYALKCLIMTNISHEIDEWHLLCKIQNLLLEKEINYVRSFHPLQLKSFSVPTPNKSLKLDPDNANAFTKKLTLYTRASTSFSYPQPLHEKQITVVHIDSFKEDFSYEVSLLESSPQKKRCYDLCIIL